MAKGVTGIIGGSGLASKGFVGDADPQAVVTPHGAPSDALRVGRHGNHRVVFLARHGPTHSLPPHRLNHQANLWALKELGVTHILATSSTGSLKTSLRPGTFVVPHDYVAFWNIPTFFDDTVHHATPSLDETLRHVLYRAAKSQKVIARPRGVYVQTSGPRLETRAEIAHFRGLGDILGMTMASEATLASELDIPYASLCSVDNYCHGIVDEPLTYEAIRRTQRVNADAARSILMRAVEDLP